MLLLRAWSVGVRPVGMVGWLQTTSWGVWGEQGKLLGGTDTAPPKSPRLSQP